MSFGRFKRIACFFVLGVMTTVMPSIADETALPKDIVERRDVVYATRPTGDVKLDLFTPRGDGPFPLVIWIHGGGWQGGDKAAWSHMNFLVGEGFAVANVGYRFSQVATFPAQLDDCTAALNHLAGRAAEYRIDPNRIAVSGESAGGHLAALVGMGRSAKRSTTRPASEGRVRAVIDLFGPTDLAAAVGDPQVRSLVETLVGGSMATKADVIRDASPLTHVAKDNPPFLILHGSNDTLVPPSHSEHLADALKAAGVPADYVRIEGAGHAGGEFWTPAMRARMVMFLRSNLTK